MIFITRNCVITCSFVVVFFGEWGLIEVREKVKMRENKVDGDTFTCLCAFGGVLEVGVC